MKTSPSTSFAVIILLLTFVMGLWLGWHANNIIAQDTCLDRGGAWNHKTRSCEMERSNRH